jgi:hypothetical protein
MGHDGDRRLLEIELQDGAVHQYRRVPSSVYTGLMAASSHGSYFRAYVRDQYPYHQVH